MERFIRFKLRAPMAILWLTLLLGACEKGDRPQLVLHEPGEAGATASATSIKFGESITFADLSTKVHRRSWVFEGGDPAISSDSVVTVTYPRGGSFKTVLNVVFIDNQKGQYVFDVEVEKDPNLTIPEYDFGVTYGLYTEMETTAGSLNSVRAINMNHFVPTVIPEALEGVQAYKFEASGESDWAMAALQEGSGRNIDISSFENGFYNVALKSESQANMLLRIRSTGGGNVIFEFTAAGEEYGFKRDGRWHLISIPVADIKAKDEANTLNLAEITDFLLFRSGSGDVRNYDNYTFYVDHVFMSEKLELKQ
ncbi:hypothetical protein ACFOET_20275 [Parapedobacter deserti]|uniref:PKD domain-containing protein n=1 Tax=Parapedobacter deserti TaxID=1912957 RepID=A0ABV7JPP0_9SPHI